MFSASSRLLNKKNFKEPSRPRAEALEAQHVVGAATKTLGTQSIFLGSPSYLANIMQQP